MNNTYEGVLTGMELAWRGSLVRNEATGYGLFYLTEEMLKEKSTDFKGKTVVGSGSGNVAIYAVEKVHQLGGKVVAMSESSGYIVDEDGIRLDTVKQIKEVNIKRTKASVTAQAPAKFI